MMQIIAARLMLELSGCEAFAFKEILAIMLNTERNHCARYQEVPIDQTQSSKLSQAKYID